MNNTHSHDTRIITLQEAAVILHVSYSTVRRLAEQGKLAAFRIEGIWRTSDTACYTYVQRQLQQQQARNESVRDRP